MLITSVLFLVNLPSIQLTMLVMLVSCAMVVLGDLNPPTQQLVIFVLRVLIVTPQV